MSLYTVGEENTIFKTEIVLKIKRRIQSLIEQAIPKSAPEQQEDMDYIYYEWGEIDTDFYNRIVFSLTRTNRDDYLKVCFTDIAIDRSRKTEWDDCNLGLSDQKIIAFIKRFWDEYAPKTAVESP